ncbi:hypothetical protein L3Q82_020161 [Scortum barcoo]|uniref:Uncharacterized protein n=1 Tax=Scortum barcoo TaxID=214431 RepID=A0ACB8VB61_9TELE|nr:hypothetical protein L3Q82_020161 [Scortum barcoo]
MTSERRPEVSESCDGGLLDRNRRREIQWFSYRSRRKVQQGAAELLSTGLMECASSAVSYLSWALIWGGLVYLWRQTRSHTPYGRYCPGEARCCPAWLAWFLQEVPALLLPLLLLLTEERHTGADRSTGRTLLLCTFMLHYLHRSFIYAFLTRGRPVPLPIVLYAFIFCSLNGFLQGHHLLHCAQFEDGWLTDARLTAGGLLFGVGMMINIHSDHILRNLRKPGETIYRIPHAAYKFVLVSQGEFLSSCLVLTSSGRLWNGVVMLCPPGLYPPSHSPGDTTTFHHLLDRAQSLPPPQVASLSDSLPSQQSSSMASPNSSQTRVFASRTVRAAACLACRYLSTASRSPTGQHGPIGLLLQSDSIPLLPVSTTGFGIATTTGTRDLASHNFEPPRRQWRQRTWSTRTQCLPASLGICEKLFRRWELKTSLTEGSARRSQQTLTIRLGLPGLSNFLLCQRSQLTTR